MSGKLDGKVAVVTVSPGPIDTPRLDGLVRTDAEAQQMKARLAAAIPLGRIGEADEVGKTAVFLASDDSSFVNGIELFVDGGMAPPPCCWAG
jgi:NAD(P)-dependent dehydrogenase (short-subunit alcohol dehydrogenase family)